MKDRESGTSAICYSLGHEEVPATHEMYHRGEWIGYCASCARRIQDKGHPWPLRELERQG